MRKSVARLAAVGAIIATITLAGCSADTAGSSDTESKGALAMSYAGMDIQIWLDTLEFMKPIIEEAGYTLVTDDPRWDIQTQISDWQAWIQRGDVKAIMGYPIQSDSLIPVTGEAVAAGVPVVGYASSWDGVEYSLVLDNYEDGLTLGRQAGEWLLKTHGNGEVPIALVADRSADLARLRAEGIEAGLAETAPNAKIYDIGSATRQDAYAAAQSQLTAVPDTKAWLAIGDDPGLGIYQAVIDSGVAADDSDYLVSSLDATNESLDIIKKENSIWRFGYILPAQALAEKNAAMLIAAAEGTLSGDEVLHSIAVGASNADEYYVD